ncbi:Endonuclease YncB, thermonuclease family [Thiocapsa roseopersicina]|uniref:Endonuclease YncB, thermonuclease family n=1 Tax=Thiocapsa roseopersicina TaxID=1058 RepID=A0A1H3CK34_THIRO|nr:Endonuclease YncB, thermonuclease family [Thiocapsa roseopersicina]
MQNPIQKRVIPRPKSAPFGPRSAFPSRHDTARRRERSTIWGHLRAILERPRSAPFRPRLGLPAGAVLALLILPPVHADTLAGKVVRILDGDTVEVLDARKQTYRIRLSAVDAPESKQPFGAKAKRALSALVAGETVSVEWRKIDRYDRRVGVLILDGTDVNLALVRAGFAWWYRAYAGEQSARDRQLYEAAEQAARREGLGLWSDPRPIAPWDWRAGGAPAKPSVGACPCDSGRTCTGPRGGIYCLRGSGTKQYFKRE